MKKSILQKLLTYLAWATLKKYKPIIIGITGSVGKTSTRMAIAALLSRKYCVRTAEKNYNTEIGLPLTILGLPHYGKNIIRWCIGFLRALTALFVAKKYPQVLVLEYGIDHPGDMDKLISIVCPHHVVITTIGDVPAHTEFFDTITAVIAEKTKLVEAVSSAGTVILNHDDTAVYGMKKHAKSPVFTFGFDPHADFKIEYFETRNRKDVELGEIPAGISFKVMYKGAFVPFRVEGALGKPNAYAATAASAVAVSFGMNLVDVSEAISRYFIPPAGRMRLLEGIKRSSILDDTYNAAPEAMRSALATLHELPGRRKIAVLGDMLEIGKYTEQVHRAIGDQAARIAELLVTVGPRAKFIADEARLRGMDPKNIAWFDDALGAGKFLKPLIQNGDLVLVKGSQSMRMEYAVEELMLHPDMAEELLVRQDKYWKAK